MSETVPTLAPIEFRAVSTFRRSDDPPATEIEEASHAAASSAVGSFRVALVNMPFAKATVPSLQIGLLKAICREAGFPVDDFYPNLDLAAMLCVDVYRDIMGDNQNDRTGEWLASVAAFGEDASKEDYFGAFPDQALRALEFTGKDVAYANDLRERVVPKFIDSCLDGVDWGEYSAVAFVLNFQQMVASLALAKRIKARFPHVAIVLAGRQVDGSMGVGYLRAFPFLDYSISGEPEVVFPELMRRLAEGRDPSDLIGLVARRGDTISYHGSAKPVEDLDGLPFPDYSSFYRAIRRYDIDGFDADRIDRGVLNYDWGIPIEGSRGCSWGEKMCCSFCGCVGTSMASRAKSPERMLAEIEALSAQCGSKVFHAWDYILEMRHLKGVFGELAARGGDYQFYICIKSSLSRDQVRMLAQGGVHMVVPGIESFSTHPLEIMRKGVTRLHNVNLLRWASYYGVRAYYHLLNGFPDETLADYAVELETAKLITHLKPPGRCLKLRLERFSPYFDDTKLFPLEVRRPTATYRYIYPKYVDLNETANVWEFEPVAGMLPIETSRGIEEFVELWKNDWNRGGSALTYRATDDGMVIEDTRFNSNRPRFTHLDDLDARIYEAFSASARRPAKVWTELEAAGFGAEVDEDTVTVTCEAFCDAGLMIGEEGKYLSLAIPADPEF